MMYAPLEHLDQTLAMMIGESWEDLSARDLLWIGYTIQRLCHGAPWHQGAVDDIDTLMRIKLEQESATKSEGCHG